MAYIYEENEKEIYLRNPTIADIIHEAKRLCNKNEIDYDPFEVGVATDYGCNVVVYIKGKENV